MIRVGNSLPEYLIVNVKQLSKLLNGGIGVDKSNKKPRYLMNDLNSVYTHWDSKTQKNIITKNTLERGTDKNGKSSK